MNMETQSRVTNETVRDALLADHLSVIENIFSQGDTSLSVHDRQILENVEKNSGEIGGRTALVAEYALRKHIVSLKKRNEEIKRILNSNESFNRRSLEEEVERNKKEIAMVESNCLQTLGKINSNL